MENGREKKFRLTVNVDESNYLLLQWLKINLQDEYSFTVNRLLTRHREEVTAGMTEYEKEQIKNLKVVNDRGSIDLTRIKNLRSTALVDQVDKTLKDPEKRNAIRALLNLYEK